MAQLPGKGFNIDDFRAVMAKKGIARSNLYKLVITMPPGLKSNARALNMPTSLGDLDDICLYCESVTLPGLQLATTESKPYGYGPQEQKAYAPVFNQMQASFIVDAKGYTLSFFRNWMRAIVNYTSEGKAYYRASAPGPRGGKNAVFESSYKAEYETMMELYVISGVATQSTDNSLKVELVTKTTITRAFPTMLGDAVLNYGVTDQYLSVPITFSFFDWFSDNINVADVPGGLSTNGDFYLPNNTSPAS